MAALPFLANENGPAWLPGAAREARQFAYWGQLIMLVFTIIAAIAAVPSLVFGSLGSGIYLLVAAALGIVLLNMLNQTVFEPLDQGKFKEVSDRLLIWGIIGLVVMVIPGLFLLLAYVKLQEVFQPQYQQYPTQYYQAPQPYPGQAPPPQYQAPPAQPNQPQPEQQYQQQYPAPASQQAPPPQHQVPPQQTKQDMVKCKNCGVQYPSFMRNCPSCGAPRN